MKLVPPRRPSSLIFVPDFLPIHSKSPVVLVPFLFHSIELLPNLGIKYWFWESKFDIFENKIILFSQNILRYHSFPIIFPREKMFPKVFATISYRKSSQKFISIIFLPLKTYPLIFLLCVRLIMKWVSAVVGVCLLLKNKNLTIFIWKNFKSSHKRCYLQDICLPAFQKTCYHRRFFWKENNFINLQF